jgi:hypothetical protein
VDYGPAEDVHEMVGWNSAARKRHLLMQNRLNTKIEPRELVVVDLVKDLSDGVCIFPRDLLH